MKVKRESKTEAENVLTNNMIEGFMMTKFTEKNKGKINEILFENIKFY